MRFFGESESVILGSRSRWRVAAATPTRQRERFGARYRRRLSGVIRGDSYRAKDPRKARRGRQPVDRLRRDRTDLPGLVAATDTVHPQSRQLIRWQIVGMDLSLPGTDPVVARHQLVVGREDPDLLKAAAHLQPLVDQPAGGRMVGPLEGHVAVPPQLHARPRRTPLALFGRKCRVGPSLAPKPPPLGLSTSSSYYDGERESALSWQHLLQDLKARGLTDHAFLAVADGALGFWKAVEEVFPGVRTQQCCVHKTANVLDKLPKRVRPDAKSLLHEMYMADTRKEAEDAYDRFRKLYGARRPKAAECLEKDRDVLFTFYDYPAAHWVHLRTTNPIESTFATVRHRTRQTRGCGSRITTLTMVFKLATEEGKHWRRLNGHVVEGDPFVDGERQLQEAA